ncbi:uncharacterized protein VTP21DRAFT_1723 [Calcarisporiella thermophila]|uniref:uncharacterized protein n=1 Tax=Calcarisporiella thermophila TaxID=911321 RepID=UPI0037429798
MSLPNLYIRRTATSAERPCFICNKLVKTFLANEAGTDWFYVCGSHLDDRGFCTPVPPPAPSSPSANARETSKPDESAEASTKDKPETKGEKEKQTGNEKEATSPPPPLPKSNQFILNRNIFYLREREIRLKKERMEARKAMEKLGPLPSVPKGLP